MKQIDVDTVSLRVYNYLRKEKQIWAKDYLPKEEYLPKEITMRRYNSLKMKTLS